MRKVAEITDSVLATVSREAALEEVAHSSIPVAEHGRLVGLVARVDVLDPLVRE